MIDDVYVELTRVKSSNQLVSETRVKRQQIDDCTLICKSQIAANLSLCLRFWNVDNRLANNIAILVNYRNQVPRLFHLTQFHSSNVYVSIILRDRSDVIVKMSQLELDNLKLICVTLLLIEMFFFPLLTT